MAKVYKRQTSILPVNPNKTYFEKINSISLDKDEIRIGATGRAVNAMISAHDEMEVFMPRILAMAPNSPHWDKRLSDYWNSVSIIVPRAGLKLDTSIRFDYNTNNKRLRENIDNLSKRNKNITDTDSLMKYVMTSGKVSEEDIYNYGTPVNIEKYLIWRYVLNHGEVANKKEDIRKSPNKIRFYLHTPGDEIKQKEEEYSNSLKLDELYIKNVVSNPTMIDALIIMMSIDELGNIKTAPSDFKDEQSKQMFLYNLKSTKPNKMLSLLTNMDKNSLLKRAEINNFVYRGLLKRLSGSTTIVDPNAPDHVIGSNIDEAISYLNSEKGKSFYDELKIRYKQLDKNKEPVDNA